jgi:beta-lactamase superfamily II metal-dependent hydrolase
VIDGGYYGDGSAIGEIIKSQGGLVKAWILTHPHFDHIGAFLNCMIEGAEGITVQNVYYSPFTRDFFKNSSNIQNDLSNEANNFEDFEKVREMKGNATFIPMKKGDQLNLEGMNINCLWSFDPAIDDINDNSLVLRIEMNGVSLLITGDITEKIVDKLIQNDNNNENYLDVDFIQIPHHGYTGTGTKLYQITSPQFALLDCSLKEYTENILNIQDETVNNLHSNGIGIVKRFEGTNVIVIR